MSRIVLSTRVRDDFDRIFDFLFQHAPESASKRIEAIVQAIDILATSPFIGHPVAFGQRELMIACGANGYLALYRFDPPSDMVSVLAVRRQRERGYVAKSRTATDAKVAQTWTEAPLADDSEWVW